MRVKVVLVRDEFGALVKDLEERCEECLKDSQIQLRPFPLHSNLYEASA